MICELLAVPAIFDAPSFVLADSAFKGTALLILAGAAAMVLRRDSAATRRLVWLLAIAAMLVVPVLSVMLPHWRVLPWWAGVPVKTAVADSSRPSIERSPDGAVGMPSDANAGIVEPLSTEHQAALHLPNSRPALATAEVTPQPRVWKWNVFNALPLVWEVGFCLLIVRLMAAQWMLWNTEGQATVFWPSRQPEKAANDPIVMALEAVRKQLGIRRPVMLLIHSQKAIPALWGIVRCCLLLPTDARDWSGERLRAVLLHELAHVKRRDVMVQLLAQIACALHWFNPPVWLAAWRLGAESECACDDLVLAHGVRASAYAEYLLTAVTKLSPAFGTSGCGLAMARKSSLESRLAAVLSENVNRRAVSAALAAIALAMMAGVAVPLAMLRAADEKPAEKSEPADGQQMLKLPVRVVDGDGKPVAGAKIIPWALRSSQGHGWWNDNDKGAGVGPKEVVTREDGTATVLYPCYREVQEQVRTLAVSLYVDHPEFAFVDDLHIDVPLDSKGPYEVKLQSGVPVEIRPLIDGKAISLDSVFLFWSDGRSWRKGPASEKSADGSLRIPAMPPGKNSVLAVKLDGQRATHFSRIVDFELKAGEPKKIDVPLRPSSRIQGVLSDNVPRPIRHGRITTYTLPPAGAAANRAEWFSWTPIQPDGTFTIDGWPAGERMQLIALCDGYIAASGRAPDVVERPRDPKQDSFNRPQVFDSTEDGRITVAMSPLVRCLVTAVDEDEKPIAGVTVGSCPNVGWWNWGSQIYCHPLVRCERLLHEREYSKAMDEAGPAPFQATTDARGKATLELPAGSEDLAVWSEVFELPVFLGRRDVRVILIPGRTTEVTLRLQPNGTEKLGEWDKLDGVVFGCSTREGRRICALPDVQKKMDEFAERFREAKNRRDPELLSDAYNAVADDFMSIGDPEEAAKWRTKAAEQAAKAKTAKERAAGIR